MKPVHSEPGGRKVKGLQRRCGKSRIGLKMDMISWAPSGRFGYGKFIFFLPLILPVLLGLQGCLNHRFYQPDQIIYDTPARYNLAYADVFFSSKDGTKLHGWFLPAAGEAVGTVIHFHGNYGNLTYYLKQIHWLPSKNFNVFTFDYRGYGRSAGTPSRRGLYEDSISALEYLRSRPDADRKNIFVFGQSLGGANAVAALAAGGCPEVRALALEGTFSSYRSEARDQMAAAARKNLGDVPLLNLAVRPFSFLAVSDSFSPDEIIARLSPLPVLLIHCREDTIVSVRHAEQLYRQARDPKRLWLIEGCRHLQVFEGNRAEDDYRQALVQFFSIHRKENQQTFKGLRF